jgi:hypothetical protein
MDIGCVLIGQKQVEAPIIPVELKGKCNLANPCFATKLSNLGGCLDGTVKLLKLHFDVKY